MCGLRLYYASTELSELLLLLVDDDDLDADCELDELRVDLLDVLLEVELDELLFVLDVEEELTDLLLLLDVDEEDEETKSPSFPRKQTSTSILPEVP